LAYRSGWIAALEQAAVVAVGLPLAPLAVALPVLVLPVVPLDDEMLEHAARTLIVAVPAATASTVRLTRLTSLG
jgi:hypothetical protein